MTTKPFTCADKAAGYEIKDVLHLSTARKAEIKPIPAKDLETLPDALKPEIGVSVEWLHEQHAALTESIHQLQEELKTAERIHYSDLARGDRYRDSYLEAREEIDRLKKERVLQDDALLASEKQLAKYKQLFFGVTDVLRGLEETE